MQDQPHFVMGQDGQLYPAPLHHPQHESNPQQQAFYSMDPYQYPQQQQDTNYLHEKSQLSSTSQAHVSNRLMGFDASSASNSPTYYQISQIPSDLNGNRLTQQTMYQHSSYSDTGLTHNGVPLDSNYGAFPNAPTMEHTFSNTGHLIQPDHYGAVDQFQHQTFQPSEMNNGQIPQYPGFTSYMPSQRDGESNQQTQQPYNEHSFGSHMQSQQTAHASSNVHLAPYIMTNPQSASPERSDDTARTNITDQGTIGKKQKSVESTTDETRHGIAPPVKNACLACRAKKARCDGGQPICRQCHAKGRECQYVKSRRGGARKKKEQVQAAPTALAQFLKRLDDLAGFKLDVPPDMGELQVNDGKAVDPALAVRTWNPEDIHGILSAYWEEIHPFQPLLPPVKHLPFIASRLQSDSPFLIAIRAILALCPNPEDPAAKSLASRAMRRSQAARLAREASSRVEDMLSEASENDRQPSIECIQALALLGLYEFAQNGNPVKNRMRMNQAVQVAMEMGLHQIDKSSYDSPGSQRLKIMPAKAVEGEDVLKDMSRRTWWVAFAAMLISGLVAGSRPVVAHDDKRIAVNYPACTLDDDSWSNWVESIGLACEAMDIIMTLDFDFPNPEAPEALADDDESSDEEIQAISDPIAREAAVKKKRLHKKMLNLDKTVLDLLKKGEAKAVIPLVPGGEEEVVRNQQLAASMMLAVCHVQLHRRQAFPEVALFSRKMCGLPKVDAVKVPPTPEQPLSVYSGGSGSGFTSNESPSGVESVYAGSQVLSSYHDSASLVSGTINDKPFRGAGYTLPITPVNQMRFQSQQNLGNTHLDAQALRQLPMDGLLWDSSIYPQSFPAPWFALQRGAGALYQPITESPAFLPPVPGIFTAETGYIGMPLTGYEAGSNQYPTDQGTASMQEISPTHAARTQAPATQRTSVPQPTATGRSMPALSETASASGQPEKQHKAWGVDVCRAEVKLSVDRETASQGISDGNGSAGGASEDPVIVGPDGPFPPGVSLQRCATAAHSVVRLEVLHRSATLAMWKGPPKWLPFCACGLVCGAYSFLLLCLAVQAGDNFVGNSEMPSEELEALWTNVKVILAGLEAYGQMWDGIDIMASEVKAALDAATKLPTEIASSVTEAQA